MSDQTLDLETTIRRDRPTATDGSIQVSTDSTDSTEGSRVLLGFGDDREVTFAVLTPTEAQTIATALEDDDLDPHLEQYLRVRKETSVLFLSQTSP